MCALIVIEFERQQELDYLRSLCTKAHVSTHLEIYMSNLLTAARHHPSLQGTLLSARCVGNLTDFVRASRVVFGPSIDSSRMEQEPSDEGIDCSEKDVSRVLAGVLGHRLAVRQQTDGPMGSMVRTAVSLDGQTRDKDSTPYHESINSVLSGILIKV